MSGSLDASGGLPQLIGDGRRLPPAVIARRSRDRRGVVGMQAATGLAAILIGQRRQGGGERRMTGRASWYMSRILQGGTGNGGKHAVCLRGVEIYRQGECRRS